MKDALAEKEAGPTSVTLDPPPESERLLKISSPQEILLENLGSPLGESCQRKLTERGIQKQCLPRKSLLDCPESLSGPTLGNQKKRIPWVENWLE